MTVFLLETYVVKAEKQAEFKAWAKKYRTYIKEHPDLFKEAESHKIFSQIFGGLWGGYVEMWEAESLADLEKCMNRILTNEEYMTTLYAEVMALVVSATYSMSVWAPVE